MAKGKDQRGDTAATLAANIAKLEPADRRLLAEMIHEGNDAKMSAALGRILAGETVLDPAKIAQQEALEAYGQAREEIVSARLAKADTGFIAEPLIPGAWQDMKPEALAAIAKATTTLGMLGKEPPIFERGRMLAMACYPETLLYEVQVQTEDGTPALAVILHAPGYLRLCDGQARRLHLLNEREGFPVVETPEQAREYFELFCSVVHGVEGRFKIHSFDPELWPEIAKAHAVEPAIDGITLNEDEETKNWSASGLVHYAGNLFEAKFRVDPGGMVEMIDDNPVGELASDEHWSGPLRFAGAPKSEPEGKDETDDGA